MTPAGLPDWLSPGGGMGFFTPHPIASDEDYATVNRMALVKERMLIKMVGEVIGVKCWLASPWEGLNEETGKEEKGIRIGLLLDDDSVAVTYAYMVRKALIMATSRYGCKVWDPPVKFIVQEEPGKKVGNKLLLVPTFDGVTFHQKGKRK